MAKKLEQVHGRTVEVMTDKQELHLRGIKDNFLIEVDDKYRKGQREHGGDLMCDISLLDLVERAMQECVDGYVYLNTIRERLIGRR